MAHRKLEFTMPADAAVVFDAFHFHRWRLRWDSLVSATQVVGGAPCPCVGAVTENQGAGALKALSMRTEFVAYAPPHLAAATMLEPAFPFTRWAASMKHRPLGPCQSVLVYVYTFEVGPRVLRWVLAPVVEWVFVRQTHRRFGRLHDFLTHHADEVGRWQQAGRPMD